MASRIDRRRGAVAGVALMLAPLAVPAAEPPSDAVVDHWQVRADAEQWRLPDDESMGMLRLALRRRFGERVAAGVDGSAAVRGSRGGFITLGIGAEALVPLTAHLGAEAGVSLQAGGGRGGYQVTGGGLMTRAQLGLRYQASGADAVSAGVSHVDFAAGGSIRSTQLYVAYLHDFTGWSLAAGADPQRIAPMSLESGTQRLGVLVEPLWVDRGVVNGSGTRQGNIGLVGAEWQAGLGGGLYTRIAAAGAASGSSRGYMQVLGGIGYRRPVASALALFASASLGAGGGGNVDTGGGVLLEAAAGLSWAAGRRDALELSALWMQAPSAVFGARGMAFRLAHRFGPDDGLAPAPVTHTEAHAVRVRIVNQEYRAASAAWTSRPNRSFGTLGVQADYFVAPAWYLTGQGLAAAHGQNGAYMIGLVGAGWHHGLGTRAYLEFEALAGAAGGGGAEVGSGAVGQVNLGVGYETPGGLGVRAGCGRLDAWRGRFAANVAEVAFTYRMRLLSAAD